MRHDEVWETETYEELSSDTQLIEPNRIYTEEIDDEYFRVSTPSSYGIKTMSESDRPMEKLKAMGSEALSDTELFAILIGTGTRGLSALNLANQLLAHVGNHENLMDITIEELMEVKGIGFSKACRIISGLELGKRISRRKSIRRFRVDSPETVANIFMERYKYEEKEHFSILLLDTKNNIIGEIRISTGDLNRSIVNPREVFKFAVKRSANAIILVHNHPSGDSTPSKEDIEVTERLIKGAEILGIKLLDHLVIGYNEFYSMREHNII